MPNESTFYSKVKVLLLSILYNCYQNEMISEITRLDY